ncbi:MAG: SAM-dependent chlorinase/fluorinase, partial [Sediminibacterium sp.]|nr:SAM-dependent chlorinase/fluorinase [Sediminibacterium sp.]
MLEVPVLFIDHFENVILNINKAMFYELKRERKFKILVSRKHHITEISNHYGSVKDGQYLAWFNSANYLEISVRGGNTAGLFGMQNYHENHSKTTMFYNKVQIVFEEL